MPKPKKKQRHEAKRKAKKLAARKRDSISPVKRLADAPGEIECWMSIDFERLNQASIFCYKRGAGLTGMACFLVDRGVVGLKDAYIRMNVSLDEFMDLVELSSTPDIKLRKVSLEAARQRVAGAIRWTHDNGMRLPKDWPRTASLIGGVGDWTTADVSEFTKSFTGHPEDLRLRLISEPFENYIQRSDITFLFSDNAVYADEDGEYQRDAWDEFDLEGFDNEEDDDEPDPDDPGLNLLAGKCTPASVALAGQTATWLNARNVAPSPELAEAWKSLMMAILLAKSGVPTDPFTTDELSFELLQSLSSRIPAPRFSDYDRAVGQVLEHLESNTSLMQHAVLEYGFGEEA